MPPTTVAITGSLLDAFGAGIAGGWLLIAADRSGTIVGYLTGGAVRVPIGLDGSVSFSLVPNDDSDPESRYRVQYFSPSGLRLGVRVWNVTAAADIGDL